MSTLFRCHNETFNIWSHLIAKLVYIAIFCYILIYFQNPNYFGQESFKELSQWSNVTISDKDLLLTKVYNFTGSKYKTLEKELDDEQKSNPKEGGLMKLLHGKADEIEKLAYLIVSNVRQVYSRNSYSKAGVLD